MDVGGGVGLPSGTVTFLFTDLVGSSRLWSEFPDVMVGALERHDVIVRSAIESHGGYVFATGGDGFCAAFAAASDAVNAAVEAQRRLGTEEWPARCVLAARMGVHSGEAKERGGDYFGSTLNRIGRLHAVGHGGQILVSDTTQPLIRGHVELRDLGRFRLRDFDDAASVFQVIADGLGTEFAALRTLDTLQHNLPLPVDEFVGRERELRELTASLRASRIVTLTGVGGTGKTRIAVEAAAAGLNRFVDGVYLVELAPVTEPAAVPFVVGDVVGAVQQEGLTMVDSLVRSLAARNVLLVLDNCEHLLDGAAVLVSTLVAKCPELVVLATSREGLAIRGEQIVATPSLTTDEGVQLFVARATAGGATLSDSDHVDVVEVVERLDGLPLAIELAAARTNALSVAEIGERLDDRFRLLRGGGRGRRERHQTLWNTVAWSYDLLSETEQAIFGRLSVFAGGFTLDAAQGVCAPEFDEFELEDAIIAFVERSLLVTEQTSVGTRYEMLETLRQFGEAQLDDTITGAIRARHAAWYADFAEQAYTGIFGTDGIAWNQRQLAEIDNLRAAVYGADHDAACRVVAAMAGLWWWRLDYEYVDWALQVLNFPGSDPERSTLALVQGLVAAQNAGRFEDAGRLRAAVGPSDELEGVALCWWLTDSFIDATLSGQPENVHPPTALFEHALSLGDESDRWVWIQFMSTGFIMTGDLTMASEVWDRHVDAVARDQIPAAECHGRFHHGRYLAAVGEPGARAEFERAADLAGRLEWPLFEHISLSELAAALAADGELEAARPRLADATRTWIRVGDLGQLFVTLHHVVDFLAKNGDVVRARAVWAQLRDRPGFASQKQRSALHDQFGEPPATTLTDEQLVVLARDLADQLSR